MTLSSGRMRMAFFSRPANEWGKGEGDMDTRQWSPCSGMFRAFAPYNSLILTEDFKGFGITLRETCTGSSNPLPFVIRYTSL